MPVYKGLVLSFAPEALERCFAVADVLEEVYHQPHLEYGLIGLAAQSRPFHVVATLLLSGQDVGLGRVYQSGHNVLSMRHEVAALSKRLKLPLVLTTFIHRHPRACKPSTTDNEFLAGAFVDQVSTVVSFKEKRRVGADGLHHACLKGARIQEQDRLLSAPRLTVEVRFSIAFSLIVNRDRDHYLYAVRKERCMNCTADSVRFIPAELTVSPERALSPRERDRIRAELESEVKSKLRFDGNAVHVGVLR